MTSKWYFRPMVRGETNVDPIQREFFTTEALEGPADAIVRETIQNSLDAGEEGAKVLVRFFLSGKIGALPYERAERFFHGLWPHLKSEANGLAAIPVEGESVPFLVIEDFQTRGLTGDPAQAEDVEGVSAKNDFFYFWRNVGRSGKAEKDRGRWGLGKTVFPSSSRVQTFWGLTIRHEDPFSLLMGQSVLKTHRLDDRRRYPYGYYGLTADEDFVDPVTDRACLSDFASRFSLKREDETGLSIVIPFPLEEITRTEIINAVVRQFFYPILSGSLVVEIDEGRDSLTIDDENLRATVEGTDDTTRNQIMPVLKLAGWSFEESKCNFVVVGEHPQDKKPDWTKDLLNEDDLKRASREFEEGGAVAFRVPVWIRREHNGAAKSHFEVFLQRDSGPEAYRPVFVRQGIIISDAVRRKIPGVRALVVVEDKPLATLLGDCENPAHTEWQDRSGHFKGRYKLGPSVLRFVKNSVANLVQMMSHSEEEADPSVLLDFFFLPEDTDEERQRRTPFAGPKKGPGVTPEPPTIDGVRPRFRIEHIHGGFTVHSVRGITPPEELLVRVAFEVRRGNAFKRYRPEDFELGKTPIAIETEGAVCSTDRNQLSVKVLQEDFKISVRGFDTERDLVVRGTIAEASHDS